jgi:hypothetical protein
VRIGVFFPDVSPVTSEQVVDEIDSIKMTSRVEAVWMEPRTAFSPPHVYWTRVYFTSPEIADLCALELTMPNRLSKWRHFVTQRLPLLGPTYGSLHYIPPIMDPATGVIVPSPYGASLLPVAFERFHAEPTDSVAVATRDGWCLFSTDELYRTRGLVEHCAIRQQHQPVALKSEPLVICPLFDPDRCVVCSEGLECRAVHVKAESMWRCLVPISLRAPPHPVPSHIDGSTVWQNQRKYDTLVLRYIKDDQTAWAVRYMFSGCAGFVGADVVCTRDGRRFGLVRFADAASATLALLQTAESSLNVSFYGALEDLRAAVGEAPSSTSLSKLPHNSFSKGSATCTLERSPQAISIAATSVVASDATKLRSGAGSGAAVPTAAGAADDEDEDRVPFPPLPEGWVHGVSRRTNQYIFFQPQTKNSTTFKHPVTGERYNMH